MDNLTHSLTGLMLSRAGLNKVTPGATWLLLLAANVPDIDVISLIGRADAYLQYHRGLTHALVMLPVVAILPVLAMRFLFRQKLPWRSAWIVSLIGVASHVALDYTNPYGVRLLVPFSDAWLGLDITSVVDVWIWTVLVLAWAAPAISGLVSSEIGAKKTTGRGWAMFALIFLLVYDAGRYVAHRRAIEVQQGRVYEGLAPKRVLVFPQNLNPLVWRGFVETEQFWSIHTVDLTREFDPTAGRLFFKSEASVAIDAARRTAIFEHFLGFSKAPVCRSGPADEPANYSEVECRDLRFGFAVVALLDEQLQVQRAWFHF